MERFGLKWLDAPMFNLIWGPGPVYLHLSCFQFGFSTCTAPTIYISMSTGCRGLLLPAGCSSTSCKRTIMRLQLFLCNCSGRKKANAAYQVRLSATERTCWCTRRAAGGMQQEQSRGDGKFGQTLLVLTCVVTCSPASTRPLPLWPRAGCCN